MVEGEPLEVEQIHEGVKDFEIKLLGVPEELPDHILGQPPCRVQELCNALSSELLGQEIDALQELETLLRVPVEVVHPDIDAPLEVLLVLHLLCPSGKVAWGGRLPNGVGALCRVLVLRRVELKLLLASLEEVVEDGQEALEGQEVRGGQLRVHWEGVLRQQVANSLEDVVPIHGAVQVGVQIHHEGRVPAEGNQALQRNLLLLI
mmetsp:Transcript_7129/g.24526  ORF Transcript_7129/g.24526 Transcript_7129/m.24526 type:complete len:205 (-) Transcript_7129:1468-2082(-)